LRQTNLLHGYMLYQLVSRSWLGKCYGSPWLTSRYAAGGLVSDDVFMRTIVSYGGSGRLASLQHEKFVRAA
jgi:hypothetical protein